MKVEDIIEDLYRFYNVSPSKDNNPDYVAEINRKLMKSSSGDSNHLLEMMINNLKEDFLYVENYTKAKELSYKISIYFNDWGGAKYRLNLFTSKILRCYTYNVENLNNKKRIDFSDSIVVDVLYLINKHDSKTNPIFELKSEKRSIFFEDEKNREAFIVFIEELIDRYGHEVGLTLLDFKISKLYQSLINYEQKYKSKTWSNFDKSIEFETNKIISVVSKYYPYYYLSEEIVFTSIYLDNYSKKECILNLVF